MANVIINNKFHGNEIEVNILHDVILCDQDGYMILIFKKEEVKSIIIENITYVKELNSNCIDGNDDIYDYIFKYKRDLLRIK